MYLFGEGHFVASVAGGLTPLLTEGLSLMNTGSKSRFPAGLAVNMPMAQKADVPQKAGPWRFQVHG